MAAKDKFHDVEKVELYCQIIQDVLSEYGKLLSARTTDDTEVQMIFDTARDHSAARPDVSSCRLLSKRKHRLCAA